MKLIKTITYFLLYMVFFASTIIILEPPNNYLLTIHELTFWIRISLCLIFATISGLFMKKSFN